MNEEITKTESHYCDTLNDLRSKKLMPYSVQRSSELGISLTKSYSKYSPQPLVVEMRSMVEQQKTALTTYFLEREDWPFPVWEINKDELYKQVHSLHYELRGERQESRRLQLQDTHFLYSSATQLVWEIESYGYNAEIEMVPIGNIRNPFGYPDVVTDAPESVWMPLSNCYIYQKKLVRDYLKEKLSSAYPHMDLIMFSLEENFSDKTATIYGKLRDTPQGKDRKKLGEETLKPHIEEMTRQWKELQQ